MFLAPLKTSDQERRKSAEVAAGLAAFFFHSSAAKFSCLHCKFVITLHAGRSSGDSEYLYSQMLLPTQVSGEPSSIYTLKIMVCPIAYTNQFITKPKAG